MHAITFFGQLCQMIFHDLRDIGLSWSLSVILLVFRPSPLLAYLYIPTWIVFDCLYLCEHSLCNNPYHDFSSKDEMFKWSMHAIGGAFRLHAIMSPLARSQSDKNGVLRHCDRLNSTTTRCLHRDLETILDAITFSLLMYWYTYFSCYKQRL